MKNKWYTILWTTILCTSPQKVIILLLETKFNMQKARKDSSVLDSLKKLRKIAAVF